jgi:hypothetical protein
MFDKIPSYFDINISFFILLVIGIISGAFAYYQYKRTVPPISKFFQVFLGTIRGSAVACVLLLIFAPEFTAIWQHTETGKLIIAIDKSASMGIVENGRNRLERALEITDKIVEETGRKIKSGIYAFDIDTMRVQDLIVDTTRLGTNINFSIKSILDAEPKGSNLVLISDGNFSQGDNPLYSDYLNDIKLFSIGVGDTLDIADIMITEVKSNKIVYQDQPTQVQVYVMSRGIEAQRLNLSMKKGSRVLEVKEIQLTGEGKTVVAEFEITPDKVGLNQYDFSLQPLSGEVIKQNNYYTISMEVLKGKIEVGLLASKPGYETKFINNLLSDREDVNFHQSVQIKSGKYYRKNPEKFIDSLDVIIMHNFPHSTQNDPQSSQIINRLNSQRVPALILLDGTVTGYQLESVKKFFPLKSIRYSGELGETQIKPTVINDQLPVISIFDNAEIEEKFWEIIPPIQYPYSNVSFSSRVKTLLQTSNGTDNNSGLPVMVTHESKGRKSILLLGSGFWRWDFLLMEDKIYQNSWAQMLNNLVRWLDTGAVDKNVILSSNKKLNQVGSNILLTTQVYDGSFKFVDDGLIRTNVTGPSVSFEIESNFVENGRYEGSFVPLVPGRYKIRSEAWRNNINLGVDEIELIVTTVNREFLMTSQNYRFLKRLSEKTGGQYFDESNASDVLNFLDLKPELKRESETFELWNRWPFLLIVIVLLSLEWFIRKKKDLA